MIEYTEEQYPAVREAGGHIDPHGIEFSVACERCGKVHTRAGDQQVIDGWRLRDSAGLSGTVEEAP